MTPKSTEQHGPDQPTPAKGREPVSLAAVKIACPPALKKRLGDTAPVSLAVLGNTSLLNLPKTALFCSVRCPGSAILPTYDQTAQWRDAGRCVISGFHSPVEKECLRILLRGTSPIILCPAASLPKRLPATWKTAITQGRMLIVSFFESPATRASKALAMRRNDCICTLAEELWFAHITPGGEANRLKTNFGGKHSISNSDGKEVSQ
jgi:predicted Rossmann fold nucleotide-binding protein DprA/Smf involved in DNA uptake